MQIETEHFCSKNLFEKCSNYVFCFCFGANNLQSFCINASFHYEAWLGLGNKARMISFNMSPAETLYPLSPSGPDPEIEPTSKYFLCTIGKMPLPFKRYIICCDVFSVRACVRKQRNPVKKTNGT